MFKKAVKRGTAYVVANKFLTSLDQTRIGLLVDKDLRTKKKQGWVCLALLIKPNKAFHYQLGNLSYRVEWVLYYENPRGSIAYDSYTRHH